jgi:hypothetical protein
MSPRQNTFGDHVAKLLVSTAPKQAAVLFEPSLIKAHFGSHEYQAIIDEAEGIRHTLSAGVCRIDVVKVLSQFR